MTFYIPPVFLFGNKVRHIRNNQEKNKAEYKTATETGIQIENRNIKRIEELEKENTELKEHKENLIWLDKKKDKEIEKLEQENKKLKADTEHTIKFNNKIIGKLKLENDKLKVIIKNNDIEQKADWKHIEELEEENKKIKADYIKLSKIVETTGGYKASYVNELRDKIAKLEFDIEALKKLKYGQEEIIIPIYDEEGKLVMK